MSAQNSLRETICGQHFWLKQDHKRRQDGDLENIDKFVAAIELLFPGQLVVNGDGMHGVHGQYTDQEGAAQGQSEEITDMKRQKHAMMVASGADVQSSYLHHGHKHTHHKHFDPQRRDAHPDRSEAHAHSAAMHAHIGHSHQPRPHRQTSHSKPHGAHAGGHHHHSAGGRAKEHGKHS